MSTYNKVLVVGAGLTSAVTTYKLASVLPQGSVYVWDKSRGAGGRMATSRSPGNPECKADMGAQYVSTPNQQGSAGQQDIYAELISAGLLHKIDTQDIVGFRSGKGEMNHFVAPQGMSSLVKHFFRRSGIDVEFNQRIADLSMKDGKWVASTDDGRQDEFEAVVVTMPVPQVLDLKGDISQLIKSDGRLLQDLQGIKYSSRFALAVFFDKPVDLGVDWSINYVSNHPIFRYVAIDNLKRGDNIGPTSIVAHTSVPFAMDRIDETPDNLKPDLMSSLQKMFPTWTTPSHVKCHKWRFSQVTQHYPGHPGSIVVNTSPLLVLAGDAFASSSNVDGCLYSATKAASNVLN